MLVIGLPFGISSRASAAPSEDASLDTAALTNPDGPAPVLNLNYLPANERYNAQSNARVNVLIQMKGDALYKAYLAAGGAHHASAATQHAALNSIRAQQAPIVSAASQYGKVVGQVHNVVNGVVVSGVKISDLTALSQ